MTAWTYDSLRRNTKAVYTPKTGATDAKKMYTNLTYRDTELTCADGKTKKATTNNVSTYINKFGNTGDAVNKFCYTYDAWGNITKIEEPTAIIIPVGNRVPFNQTGEVITGNVADITGEAVSETSEDTADTNTSAVNKTAAETIQLRRAERTYTYNAYGEITQAEETYHDGTKTSYAYTYDNGGNILTETISTAAQSDATSGETTHTYVYDTVWKDKLISYDNKAITYDVFGCPTDYMGKAMTWDVNGGLTSITDDTDSITYTYMADGQRRTKTVNGVTTTYHYNNGMLLSETTGDETLRYYYDSTGKVSSIAYKKGEGEETSYFFARNVQGDIIAVYRNSDSALIGTYEYDLWGKPVSIKEAQSGIDTDGILTKNPFRYRGYYYDSETGFYYLFKRYYDTEIRRWISPEPNVYTGGFDTGAGLTGYNVYVYCANNPIMYKDETGESITLTCVLIGAGVGLIVGAVGGSLYAKYKKELSPSDGWDYWKYTVGFGVVGGTVGALVGWGAGALIAKYGVTTAALSITKGGGAGFSSFNALKRSLGSAGVGNQWHHIVEQCQIVKSGFSEYWIHNSNNVISISNSVHKEISAYYSRIHNFTDGMTFRNWLAGQSFETQYKWGIEILRMFGVKV